MQRSYVLGWQYGLDEPISVWCVKERGCLTKKDGLYLIGKYYSAWGRWKDVRLEIFSQGSNHSPRFDSLLFFKSGFTAHIADQFVSKTAPLW